MTYMMTYIIICLYTFIIFLLFIILNKYLKTKSKEHMSMQNTRLTKILTDDGYIIDIDNFIIKKNGETFKYNSKNFNNINAHNTAKNKPLSNKIFSENNIPVPTHWIINNENKSEYINDSLKKSFPCVLKPVDGMQGEDVNTFIKNNDQFKKILEELLSKYKEIMMENQVYGDNYRIFVFNNTIIDIVKREQPFVVGNGNDNVNDLINKKNKDQLEKKLFPTKNLDWNYILEQGYAPDDILENNKKIFITNTINFHNGANPVRMDLAKVPEINKNMFINAHKLIKLDCSGIDYMSDDIYTPYNDNDGHIIEINDMVDTKIHVDADNKADENFLFKNILKSLKN